jgi:hypothetical protein
VRGSVRTGAKEDESSTGRVWAAGFHHGKGRYLWRAFRNLRTIYSFNFQFFFGPR